MAEVLLEVRAELDPPGETGLQARVFLTWFACLLGAVLFRAYYRTYSPLFALSLAVALPALLMGWLRRRHRRGGAHARGIVVDITAGPELRLWGRGYGQRVLLDGAEVSERLVDVYAGRLGAWRQRRVCVRGKQVLPGSPSVIEIGTAASDQDTGAGLPLSGGEGDCVELSRADYLALVAEVKRLAISD